LVFQQGVAVSINQLGFFVALTALDDLFRLSAGQPVAFCFSSILFSSFIFVLYNFASMAFNLTGR